MGNFQEEKIRKQDRGEFLFFVLENCIYKLDLKLHFTATDELPPQVADFSLKRCGSSKRQPLSSSPSVNHHFSFGKCNRFLTIKKRKSLPPLLPHPFLELWRCSKLHKDAAMVALGSQIFIIGGHDYVPGGLSSGISRDMFMIDIHDSDSNSNSSPCIVRKSALMNTGKRTPLAWAIGGKIYVVHDELDEPGHFECFNPHSNSWTILPTPTLPRPRRIPKFDEFEILTDRSWSDFIWPTSVSSHVVLGSYLIISLGTRTGVFAFDTAQPNKPWRRIFLSLTGTSLLLNFIPFRPAISCPIRDRTIFSRHYHDGESKFLDEFLQNRFKIGNGDSFVCTFGDLGSEFVEVSIVPLSGVNVSSRLKKSVGYWRYCKVAPIGDGLVLLYNPGLKEGKREVEEDGAIHYSFDTFRVEKDNYVASKISSAFFRAKDVYKPFDISHLFVCKDGIFTN